MGFERLDFQGSFILIMDMILYYDLGKIIMKQGSLFNMF